MKKPKKFFLFLLCILFMEGLFTFLVFDSFLKTTIINVVLSSIIFASFFTIITSIFPEKMNKIITYIILIILGILFSTHFVFKSVYESFFSLAIFGLADQVMTFGKEIAIAILKNSYAIILFFAPLIITIIFRKHISYKRVSIKSIGVSLIILVVSIGVFLGNIFIQKGDMFSTYSLYFEINDNEQNIEKLGILNATFLDITRTIFGFNEKTAIDNNSSNEKEDEQNEIFNYSYNTLNIDFDSINSSDSNVKTITNYLKKESGTKQSKYTGIFEGMNLIYITAESFSEIAVSEELTPTLYKLVTSGFEFTNYYSSNNLSTIGGEFQSLTGLFANNTILSTWRKGKNNFPYGLSTIFENAGYNTYAFHNHTYNYQDRDKYLKSLGFNNYIGCYTGMEKLMSCVPWPRSDMEMMEGTPSKYVNSEKPFMTYYMTNSGHFGYSWGNSMATKHKSAVKDLPYSEEVKAYIATQIELDQALEILINKLEEAGVLDDTVIVLLCDHYPYALSTSQVNEVSTYKRDSIVEVNSNNLIIWNNRLNHMKIDKVAMSIDVIPTVYNLFGLDYDSRLFMGKDIFSSEDGLAFFKNRSWVTNKGTYYASNKKMVSSTGETISQEYINSINSKVSNRMNMSKLILSTNYYKYLKYKN